MNQLQVLILSVVIVIVCGGLGYILGRASIKNRHDGYIFIEPTEDGEGERVRFVLELGLDEIKDKKRLAFKVENQFSQNKQVL